MNRFKQCVSVFIIAIVMVLCLKAGYAESAEVSSGDKDSYFKALVDTEIATEEEIFSSLLAVVPGWDSVNHERLHGDDLVLEGIQSNFRILVVTFMSEETYSRFYEPYMGELEYRLERNIWVTVVPEMKHFFIGRACPPTCKRVKELLGLNPAFDYEVLVEMWVDPKDLFRPTPDPEITDHRAELAYGIPQDPWPMPLGTYGTFTLLEGGSEISYQTWFADLAKTSYGREGDDPFFWGWPWTRLGYTYDWGNPDNPVGLSEFVVRIDPESGDLVVRLERAIACNTPQWDAYFRCETSSPEDSNDDHGCFINTLVKNNCFSPRRWTMRASSMKFPTTRRPTVYKEIVRTQAALN
ncbi:MAG: hypothetical protein SWQ30_11020 [Thermodesulfobacteriota bacterium]|nr:hypothetical protein [Thermodesulfobacteriota bacterium]